jgi:hypothetical protein
MRRVSSHLALYVLSLLLSVGSGKAQAPFADPSLSEELSFNCLALLPEKSPEKGFGLRHNLWSRQVIPYVFGENVGANLRKMIEDAIAIVNEQTNVCFIPRLQERDYVEIFHSDQTAYYAYVGVNISNESQPMAIGPNMQIILHEMAHTIGLHHEHQRPDRDRHILVNYHNIPRNFHSQFTIIDDNVQLATPYDYGSIMHYGRKAFSFNGFPTIEPVETDAVLGSVEFSKNDIVAINTLYPDTAVDCAAAIVQRPPKVDFDFALADEFTCAGAEVRFLDQCTGPAPTYWEWTFNEGTPSRSNEQNPTVIFSEPGSYIVTLEAGNDHGAHRQSRRITVQNPKDLPQAVYPVPVSGDELFLSLFLYPHQEITLQLFHSDGRLVDTYVRQVNDCRLETTIPLPPSLPQGAYYLRITARDDIRLKRVLIQR